MILTIDNAEVLPSLVTCNHGLNYGRFDCCDFAVLPYSVSFTHAELLHTIKGTYAAFIEGMKQDAERGEVTLLSKLGFPSLEKLLSMPPLAVDIFDTYLDRDIFADFGLLSEKAEFVINSTEQIRVEEDNVIFSGRCFHRPALST